MKRIRHTAEQIIRKLKTAEQLTYYRWKQQYVGMQAEEAKRLNQLEKDNARLKMHLAEAELERR